MENQDSRPLPSDSLGRSLSRARAEAECPFDFITVKNLS